MLTVNEQKKVIKVIGKTYSGKIIEHLTKKKIFNSNNNVYSADSIQKIVSRKRENLAVELAILQLVKTTENNQAKQAEKRKQLTSTKR